MDRENNLNNFSYNNSGEQLSLFLNLEGFEGPIDLLLHLSREQKVDLSYALGKAHEDIKDFDKTFVPIWQGLQVSWVKTNFWPILDHFVTICFLLF